MSVILVLAGSGPMLFILVLLISVAWLICIAALPFGMMSLSKSLMWSVHHAHEHHERRRRRKEKEERERREAKTPGS